ncbi:hypothetical protein PHMEG_00030972 [Phytophthora megakarya]|uniref:Reverse transcriptase n=1 Tax=Phytophthora megakarya TaxID=4795 RepID=A0A225UXP5_9STRA|nr:hypothetical protein PHMEG_00030972 [Phytophthora megakarya]
MGSLAVLQKGDLDISIDSRLIHDLSFPKDSLVNDNLDDEGEIPVSYVEAVALANRELDGATEHPGKQPMMSVDMNGAFRNIPVAVEAVGRFSGTIPELCILVIDLYWSNYPPANWMAGADINHSYSNSRPTWPGQDELDMPPFDRKVWCDDHVSIEADVGSRLSETNMALRTAMTTVLGPMLAARRKCLRGSRKT